MKLHIGALALCLWSAQGATMLFNTSPLAVATSSAGSSGPVNMQVQFVTDTDTITVTVWNFQSEFAGDIQSINSLDFLLSPQQTSIGIPGITSRSGELRTINSDGTYVDSGAFTSGWMVQNSTQIPNGLDLTTLTGAQPSETIIGPPNSNGLYGANGSILKHNPFIVTPTAYAPVVFTVNVPGVTSATTVTRTRVTFGTDLSAQMELRNAVPEPSSLALFGIGFFALAARLRLRRRS